MVFYVDLLWCEGFDVEEVSVGMLMVFCVIWLNGVGFMIGGYVEYDGISGNC